MYVPGSDERKLAKIPSLGADCICLDCEDGVAMNKKDQVWMSFVPIAKSVRVRVDEFQARTNIRAILEEQKIDFGVSECSVRVNSLDSELIDDDLKVILSARNPPSSVHLPKVDSPEAIR
jgi:citrate lyase subunit beta-like protein